MREEREEWQRVLSSCENRKSESLERKRKREEVRKSCKSIDATDRVGTGMVEDVGALSSLTLLSFSVTVTLAYFVAIATTSRSQSYLTRTMDALCFVSASQMLLVGSARLGTSIRPSSSHEYEISEHASVAGPNRLIENIEWEKNVTEDWIGMPTTALLHRKVPRGMGCGFAGCFGGTETDEYAERDAL